MSKDVSILISAHKPTDCIENSVFCPIQVGAGIKDRKEIAGFLKDNIGDNISSKNPRYCELTAQYWAWKNLDSNYYGFFHYRRYLSFSRNDNFVKDAWGNITERFIDDGAVKKYDLTSDNIKKVVDDFDIILPEQKDIRYIPNMGKNMREQYLASGYLKESDLDILRDVIKTKYPDFASYFDEYFNGHKTYLNNIFIMKKEIFYKYSEWLFDIVDECDNRIDYTGYSIEAFRTPGHLAERLLNIYIMYLKDHCDCKIKELPTIVFLNTEPFLEIKPAFDENNVAIAMSANDFYSPYLATTIESIVENSTNSRNYDILIMTKDISAANKCRINDIPSTKKNFSIRFIDISKYENRFNKLFVHGHFTIETWFRLVMPEIMPNYNKVLYLDSDLVADADVSEIYNIDVSDYLLAACHDADTAGLYNGYNKDKKNYMDNILKIRNPYEYFQAGVILFNLDKFRKEFKTDYVLEYASSRKWQLLDQDVLNDLAQDDVKNIDMSWNVMFDLDGIRVSDIISLAPKELFDEYMHSRSCVKIAHYAGPHKPWMDPECDLSQYFWKYAKNCGYYETILARMMEYRASTSKKSVKKTMKQAAKKVFPIGTKRRELVEMYYHKIKNGA